MEPQNSYNRINYLYFSAYFVLIAIMSASSVFAKTNLSGSRMFFFLYALTQAVLETALLAFLGVYIRQLLGKYCFFFFIGSTVLFLLLHFFDFMMDRILDLSVWETFQAFILDEDFHNFLYLLDASGIPLWAWGLVFFIMTLVPLIGIFFYRFTEAFTNQKPLLFKPERFLITFFCLPAGLFLWDVSASWVIHPDSYTEFLQSLPWKSTFLKPKSIVLPISGRLRRPPEETKVALRIDQEKGTILSKPNIYLFVAESLRRDFITPKIAPHLYAFGKETTFYDHTLSNANATNLAWFSIFHSQFAYHWDRVKKWDWEMGSPPLSLLKKWGYKIRVYTSAQLNYYGLEQLLFGKERNLLDSYQTFHHISPKTAAEGDAEALAKIQYDLNEDPSLKEGQIFIIFWDSTHFDYSWPKNWVPKFTPFADEFAYFKAFYSEDRIELIRNRYRNAVSYIDFLFGTFLETLPNKEEAIIIFTGDHGEEFFDHGHLFHNSHLTEEQTLIPLFMKFGTKKSPTLQKIVSQIDIFPSIIDYLSDQEFSFLEGQSIFRTKQWPYAVVARFNASRNPYEFYIHNGQNKLIARFPNRKDIIQSESLQIRSLRTADDQTIPGSSKDIRGWIIREFGPAIEALFDIKNE